MIDHFILLLMNFIKEHAVLHEQNPLEKETSHLLQGLSFGDFLLNNFEGYDLKGVVKSDDFFSFDASSLKTSPAKESTKNSSVAFFGLLFNVARFVFIETVKYICQRKKRPCSCLEIVGKISSWTFSRNRKKAKKDRNLLVLNMYKAIRKIFVETDSKNLFMLLPEDLLTSKDGCISHFSQWTYGVGPCMFMAKMIIKCKNHFMEGSGIITDWWLNCVNFTSSPIVPSEDVRIFFKKDSFSFVKKRCRSNTQTVPWIPYCATENLWLCEFEDFTNEIVNQNKNIWQRNQSFLCVYNRMSGRFITIQAIVSCSSWGFAEERLERKMKSIEKKKTWENAPVMFYRPFFSSPTFSFPSHTVWCIRKDGLITQNANDNIQIVGVLRSKIKDPVCCSHNVTLVPSINKDF